MSEKIHPPTPKKRQQAKEQGRGPNSRELISASTLLSASGILSWTGPQIARFLKHTIESAFQQQASLSIETSDVVARLSSLIIAGLLVLLPLMIGLMFVAIASGLAQTQGRVVLSRFAPSLDRFSPAKRMKSVLGTQAQLRFCVSLLKLTAIVSVSAMYVQGSMPAIVRLGQLPLAGAGASVFELLVGCSVWLGGTVLFFAIVDFAIAWWQHEQELMMTDLELREEIRNSQRANVPGPARTEAVHGVT
ncbi:EscU/YscU/HrcU family type III secretion system export apparatus switch protein [Rhodopirellula sp. MGV]|uniref:EscU/YscU/HrcU family type III secretion system export apparatus switch protein n=1 Tax=Rhodopirellula sp. MGV TaxID=2023130 RepID=UPI000B970C32|nr:EscU/YscU/HrcU family type III secretion system export apparatus switch protein [Rhodopirellula sp. MGV]OYP30362.1 hypothetical protein CGZ80_23055 [Rhodopirellula sp. MGV]PNY34717.1 hypothetical protein C2E31_22400 [Rhodopirellula baltica]